MDDWDRVLSDIERVEMEREAYYDHMESYDRG